MKPSSLRAPGRHRLSGTGKKKASMPGRGGRDGGAPSGAVSIQLTSPARCSREIAS